MSAADDHLESLMTSAAERALAELASRLGQADTATPSEVGHDSGTPTAESVQAVLDVLLVHDQALVPVTALRSVGGEPGSCRSVR